MNSPITQNGCRRFYLIAHGCNNISKINKAFRQKVNGIECDLWADDNQKWWVTHNGFGKTDLVRWLRHIGRAEKKYNRQLAVIIFDVKSAVSFAGIRDIINENLPPGLPHIYSTAKINKAHIFSEIVPLLAPHEGIAIDEEDDPKKVAAFFNKIGTSQCWYANGITLIPLNDPFHSSMRQAAPIRDTERHFSKIYTWSVHRKEALRKYILEDKVDGVIVGLNGIFTSPVSNAMEIISSTDEVQLADRNCRLF